MSPAGLKRIVIAGAASLRGKELAEALGNGALAAADVRLLDEEIAAPILAAAAGEATVVLPIAPDSFENANLVIFAGSPAFTTANIDRAVASGAAVIDMSGALRARPGVRTMIPALDPLLSPPPGATPSPAGSHLVVISPGAAAVVASSLAAAFAQPPSPNISVVLLRPVSERGAAAVEELESQTVKLLSFSASASNHFRWSGGLQSRGSLRRRKLRAPFRRAR